MDYINLKPLLFDGFKLRRSNWEENSYIEWDGDKIVFQPEGEEFHVSLSDLMSTEWDIKRN